MQFGSILTLKVVQTIRQKNAVWLVDIFFKKSNQSNAVWIGSGFLQGNKII